MADGYERFDNESGGGFVMGLLTGTVLGAGLGMLFAPKAGSELRNQIGERASTLANEGYRKATEAAGDWADRGRVMYDRARDAVARGADEAQEYIRNATEGFKGSQTATGSTGSNAPLMSGSGSTYGSGASSYGGGAETTRGSSSEHVRGTQTGGGSSHGS